MQRLTRQSEELRRRYEQYFLGVDKREPGVLRERMEIELRKCRLTNAFKTSTRFRYTQFLARYRSYCAYWERVLRQIEDGSYRKGFMTESERLATKQLEYADKLTDGTMEELAGAVESNAESDEGRISSAATAARRFLAELGISGGAKADAPDPDAALFDAYVSARREQGDDVKKITRARFERSLEKQRTRAKDQHGVDVEFDVKVTDSKVSLVARRKGKKKKK